MCDLSRNGASAQNIDTKSIASSESEEEEEDFYDIVKHGSRKQVRKRPTFVNVKIKIHKQRSKI